MFMTVVSINRICLGKYLVYYRSEYEHYMPVVSIYRIYIWLNIWFISEVRIKRICMAICMGYIGSEHKPHMSD
jgi:hypothetical protein